MIRIVLVLGLVALVLSIYCALDVARTQRREMRTPLPRSLWVGIILMVPLVGGGLWLGIGRPRTPRVRGGNGGWGSGRETPVAPDDDEEFLRIVRMRLARERAAEERRAREQRDSEENPETPRTSGDDAP